ncbi:hypothetical protein BDD12DRAFT_871992 [Trichophaea hybrida]|nr:hypothetical protein BDD12DRAFT_871992 [Trichophaea hybrida]
MSATEAGAGTIHNIAGDASTAAQVTDSNSAQDETSKITTSLENLSIVINTDASTPGQSGSVDLERAAAAISDNVTVVSSILPNHSNSSIILAQKCDSISASSENSDRSSPVIVVSPQTDEEPFSHQIQTMLCDPVDRPDPRLIDALENPRDRIFVVKLEKDLVAFIEDKSCEIFDMPPINSYHRLLAHKMAEYYRLTHVVDSSGASVRMFRGQAARIPATLLSAWPVATQQIQKAVSNGTLPTVKIMRRGGKGGSASRDSSKGPGKAGSETSSDNDNSVATSNSNSKTTREEREAAYQEARARIFKDFVESPPDTPPPGKQEKSRRQDKNDDFSGRSQFYPVMTQPIPTQYYPQQGYHDPLMQHSMQPPMQMQPAMQPNMQQQQQPPLQISQNHVQQRFNPTANFNPAANFTPSQFTPSTPPYSTLPPSRSYPNFNTARDRGYPSVPTHQQQPIQQPIYPQQNGYFPTQSPPSMHNSRSFNPNLPQPQIMQSSYSSSGGFSQQNSHGGMQPQQFNPTTTPPPVTRQHQQQQYPMPQHQMPFNTQAANLKSQRIPGQQQLGWGNIGQMPVNGGVAMAPRSSSAPAHQHHGGVIDVIPQVMGGMNGFGGGGTGMAWGGTQHGAWNGNTLGRGGGSTGGGMNMRM